MRVVTVIVASLTFVAVVQAAKPKTIYLTPGHCTKIGKTRVCAVKTKPKPKPKTATGAKVHVLFSKTGSGIYNGPTFIIHSSEIGVAYAYDCSAFGGTGNFILDVQTPGGSDDMSIANDLGRSANKVAYGYPQAPGSAYYVSINSECSWSVKVVGE